MVRIRKSDYVVATGLLLLLVATPSYLATGVDDPLLGGEEIVFPAPRDGDRLTMDLIVALDDEPPQRVAEGIVVERRALDEPDQRGATWVETWSVRGTLVHFERPDDDPLYLRIQPRTEEHLFLPDGSWVWSRDHVASEPAPDAMPQRELPPTSKVSTHVGPWCTLLAPETVRYQPDPLAATLRKWTGFLLHRPQPYQEPTGRGLLDMYCGTTEQSAGTVASPIGTLVTSVQAPDLVDQALRSFSGRFGSLDGAARSSGPDGTWIDDRLTQPWLTFTRDNDPFGAPLPGNGDVRQLERKNAQVRLFFHEGWYGVVGSASESTLGGDTSGLLRLQWLPATLQQGTTPLATVGAPAPTAAQSETLAVDTLPHLQDDLVGTVGLDDLWEAMHASAAPEWTRSIPAGAALLGYGVHAPHAYETERPDRTLHALGAPALLQDASRSTTWVQDATWYLYYGWQHEAGLGHRAVLAHVNETSGGGEVTYRFEDACEVVRDHAHDPALLITYKDAACHVLTDAAALSTSVIAPTQLLAMQPTTPSTPHGANLTLWSAVHPSVPVPAPFPQESAGRFHIIIEGDHIPQEPPEPMSQVEWRWPDGAYSAHLGSDTGLLLAAWDTRPTASMLQTTSATTTGAFAVETGPWLRTSALMGLVLVVVGFVLRWTAWLRFGGLWPGVGALYAKLRKDQVLDHERRNAIMEAIRAEPSITTRSLMQRFGLGWGNTAHHVQTLRRNGLVVALEEGGKVHLFEAGAADARTRWRAVAERSEACARILETLAEGPATVTDLARATSKDKPHVSRATRRLLKMGLVERERQGRTVVYRAPLPVSDDGGR